MKRSHPTGVRGLKYDDIDRGALLFKSHPTGVRGLKYSHVCTIVPPMRLVAPHWGAWIEITGRIPDINDRSRTPLGCVD